MRRSADDAKSRRPDLLGWFALAWAAWFGVLYLEMILRLRAPGVWAALRRVVFG